MSPHCKKDIQQKKFFFNFLLEWILTVAKVEDPEDEACIFSATRGSLWEINIGQPAPNLNLHPRVVIIFFN